MSTQTNGSAAVAATASADTTKRKSIDDTSAATAAVAANGNGKLARVDDALDVSAAKDTATTSSSSASSTAAISGELKVDGGGVDDSKKENALLAWSSLQTKLAGRKLAVFLDYDGTLTPIVSNPGDAKITPEMTAIVERLSNKHNTAIVTGRAIDTIVGFLPLKTVYYAGSHGFDIRAPGQDGQVKQVASAFLPALGAFFKAISAKVADISGSLVENNTYSISVHYRNVSNDDQVKLIESYVDELLEQYPDQLKKTHGKKVFEVRPIFDWHKGKAVEWLLQKAFKVDESKVVPIYIGDDVTDEDAFKELKAFDLSVGVHVRAPSQARATAASYTLSSIEEVGAFLTKLCDL